MVKWKGRRQSSNIEDRRGAGGRGRVALGGGTSLIILLFVFICSGGDLETVMKVAQVMPKEQPQARQVDGELKTTPAEEEMKDFVATILADTEDVWKEIFRGTRVDYREPNLVMFRNQVRSACGTTSSAVGPFYCPGDE